MIITLLRDTFTDTTTIGKLLIDGIFQCYTLEDKDRDLSDTMTEAEIAAIKQPHVTCIGYGTYNLVINDSTRFKRKMPRLEGVKGFAGILMHWGDFAVDTDGCILVGLAKSKDAVWQSRKAFDMLFTKLQKSLDAKETITVIIKKL